MHLISARTQFLFFSTHLTELEARLNATEDLDREMNTRLEKAETEMEELKTADKGEGNITDTIPSTMLLF